MIIRLPWPDSGLSPNARLHWAVRARLTKQARNFGYYVALEAGAFGPLFSKPAVLIEFLPPDRRRRDTDNMLSACKPYLDGIADALGVDDSLWRLSISRGEPTRGGAVFVTISEGVSDGEEKGAFR